MNPLKQSGIASMVIILIIVGVLVIGGGIYYFIVQKSAKPEQPVAPQETKYFTISELESLCNLPGRCNEKMSCEEKDIFAKGYIDYDNVFDKKNYPQLPYEKFRLTDKPYASTLEKSKMTEIHALEVFATGDDNSAIFKKIYDNAADPKKLVFVNGRIEGFDMPTTGQCQRGIKLNITSEKVIKF